MKKTGIVTQINKKHACILTPSGEFSKVRYKGAAPSLGEVYSGDVYSAPSLKLPMIAASLAFILFSGGLYSYMTPAYAVTVEINPSVRVQVNMWNRVIKTEAINEDGKRLLNDININNMSLNSALEKIVSEAKKDNYIDEKYTADNKAIKITVEGRKNTPAILKHFSDSLKSENINVKFGSDETVPGASGNNSNQNINKDSSNSDKQEINKDNKSDENDKDKGKSKNNDVNKKSDNKSEEKTTGKSSSSVKSPSYIGKQSNSETNENPGSGADYNRRNK